MGTRKRKRGIIVLIRLFRGVNRLVGKPSLGTRGREGERERGREEERKRGRREEETKAFLVLCYAVLCCAV